MDVEDELRPKDRRSIIKRCIRVSMDAYLISIVFVRC